jgi:superfamily II DNA or RNA helicase
MSSPVNSTVLAHPFAATLGISATPDDDYGSRLSEVLVPFLGPVVFRYSIDEAFAQGILARFDLTNVRVDFLPDERDEYDDWTRRIRRYMRRNPAAHAQGDENLQAMLRRRAVVAAKAKFRVPVAVRLVEQASGARTIVFHEFKQEAESITLASQQECDAIT